jgi:hypothetical protein
MAVSGEEVAGSSFQGRTFVRDAKARSLLLDLATSKEGLPLGQFNELRQLLSNGQQQEATLVPFLASRKSIHTTSSLEANVQHFWHNSTSMSACKKAIVEHSAGMGFWYNIMQKRFQGIGDLVPPFVPVGGPLQCEHSYMPWGGSGIHTGIAEGTSECKQYQLAEVVFKPFACPCPLSFDATVGFRLTILLVHALACHGSMPTMAAHAGGCSCICPRATNCSSCT